MQSLLPEAGGTVRGEQEPADLPVAITETIELYCGGPCQDGSPSTPWDQPACSDYDLDQSLIGSMKQGDRSALDLLRSRHDSAATYDERHLIALALLGHVADDSAYWNELYEHARNAVRFGTDGDYSDEFVQWCRERGYDPYEYEPMSYRTFELIAGEPRSRALLLQALDADAVTPNLIAISGLAIQRDLQSLPAIERALERFRDRPEISFLASALAEYRDEQADRLAFKYIEEEDREEYFALRNAPRDQ